MLVFSIGDLGTHLSKTDYNNIMQVSNFIIFSLDPGREFMI